MVRLFGKSSEFTVDSTLETLQRRCEEMFWVARWTLHIPTFTVDATEEIGLSGPEYYDIEPWLLPPSGTAGLLGNDGCFRPGFRLAEETDSLIVDVYVEIDYFELDPFAVPTSPSETSPPLRVAPQPIAGCGGVYRYDDSLPIEVCSQGFSVSLVQGALGVDSDGYFGPGTQQALITYQLRAGLPLSGAIDVATWKSLGLLEGSSYPDLNGDGVIDGSEVPGT